MSSTPTEHRRPGHLGPEPTLRDRVALVRAVGAEWHETALLLDRGCEPGDLAVVRSITDRHLAAGPPGPVRLLVEERATIDAGDARRESALVAYLTLQSAVVMDVSEQARRMRGEQARCAARLVIWLQVRMASMFLHTLVTRIASTGTADHRNMMSLLAAMAAEEALIGMAEDTADATELVQLARTMSDPVWGDWWELENRLVESPESAAAIDRAALTALAERRYAVVDVEVDLAAGRAEASQATDRSIIEVGDVLDALDVLTESTYRARLGHESFRRLFTNRELRLGADDRIIRESLVAARRLADIAGRDPVTGLPNRVRVDSALADLRSHLPAGERPACVVVHLSGLVAIVDEHGQFAGELTLCAVADRCGTGLREPDQAFRIADDRLLLVLATDGDATSETIRRRVTEALDGPVPLPQGEVDPGLLLGVAIADERDTMAALRIRADADLVRRR